nr:8684_t:CDS:1 [Entrophospora candida]
MSGTKKYMSTNYLDAFNKCDTSYQYSEWDELESLGWFFMDIRGHLNVHSLLEREQKVKQYQNEIDVRFLNETKKRNQNADNLISFLQEEMGKTGVDQIIAVENARRPIKKKKIQ